MKIRAIYTFGSPRILDPEAARYAETSLHPGRIFRHICAGDLVPEIPAKHFPETDQDERYDHAGLIASFDERGELHFGPGPWSRSKPRLRESLADLPSCAAAARSAHRLPRYNAAIYEQFRRNSLTRPNGWDPLIALACVRAARLSYKGPIRQILSLLGFAGARLVTGSAVDALLAVPVENDETPFAVLAFRSTGPEDLDLEGGELWSYLVQTARGEAVAQQEPWYSQRAPEQTVPGRAAAAWLREVVEIEPTLHDTIRRFCPGLPIVVTGHSKGGALAMLWAMRQAESIRRKEADSAPGAAAAPGALAAPDAMAAGGPSPQPLGGSPGFDTEEAWPLSTDPQLSWAPEGEAPRKDLRELSEIGSRIRFLREIHGVKQADLAARVGLEPEQLARIEHGEKEMEWETLFQVLAAFDVSVAHFFGEERRESLTPASMLWLDEVRELSDEDREAVLALLRFKLHPGD